MPRRRCVGCGRIAPKPELVRIALADRDASSEGVRTAGRRAVIDVAGRLPGRGAYLCREPGRTKPDPRCLELATRRGGIARTLRHRVDLDLTGAPNS